MLLVTGESRFADLLERTLYNGFLAGLSLDGGSFFYANPLQSRDGQRRHRWHPVACCPPNIMRLLASLHHYLATTSDGGVQTPSVRGLDDPRRRAGAGTVELAVETGYPWSGSRRRSRWSRAATLSGRSRCGCRGGRAAPSSTASRSRRDTRS